MLVQPAVLAFGAIAVGHFLAPKVGPDAPVLRMPVIKGGSLGNSALPAAVAVGAAAALSLLSYDIVTGPYFSSLGLDAASKLKALEPPLMTRLPYGGLTEEMTRRWGAMTLFVWVAWRIAGRPEVVRSLYVWIGNAVAALFFGAAHFGVLLSLTSSPPPWLFGAVLAGNSIPALMFGWLFWRRGLEAAMIAHALVDALFLGMKGIAV